MERNEVSSHEIAVWATLYRSASWLTSADIAKQSGVAPRTARAHALKLVQLNLVDKAEVFPGYRYHVAANARQRNRGYYDRLMRTAEILGTTIVNGE